MKKLKQILALLCVIFLIGLYIATLLAAIFDTSASLDLLKASLAATFIVPVLMWAFSLIYKLTHPKDENTNKDEK